MKIKLLLVLLLIIYSCKDSGTNPVIEKPINSSGVNLNSDFQIIEVGQQIKVYWDISDAAKMETVNKFYYKRENSKDYTQWSSKDTLKISDFAEGWNKIYSKIEYKDGNYSLDTLEIFGATVEKLYTSNRMILDFAISNNSKFIILSKTPDESGYHSFFIFNCETKQLELIPNQGPGCAHCATFSPDDKFIVYAGYNTIRKIELLTKNYTIFNVVGSIFYPNGSFLPTGNKFIFCENGGTIKEFDFQTGELTTIEKTGFQTINLNHSGTEFAAVSVNYETKEELLSINDYMTKKKKLEIKLKSNEPNGSYALSYSANDKWVFSNYSNTLIYLPTSKIYNIKTSSNKTLSASTFSKIDLGFLSQDNSGIFYSDELSEKIDETSSRTIEAYIIKLKLTGLIK